MCASPCLKTVSDTMQFLKRCVKLLFHLYVVMFWSMWSIKSLPRLILLTLRLFFIFALYYLDFSLCIWNITISRCTFTFSKHVSSKQENLYPVLASLTMTGIAYTSPERSFLCHLVQTCFDSETPKSFPRRVLLQLNVGLLLPTLQSNKVMLKEPQHHPWRIQNEGSKQHNTSFSASSSSKPVALSTLQPAKPTAAIKTSENKDPPLFGKTRTPVSVFHSRYLSTAIASVFIFMAPGNGNCSFYI